jgi:hypothetical protein
MLRSRITFCAASGSFQSEGSSDFAFSSARRRVAASTSKMPPQQSHRLLDVFDQRFSFGAHFEPSIGSAVDTSNRQPVRSRPPTA